MKQSSRGSDNSRSGFPERELVKLLSLFCDNVHDPALVADVKRVLSSGDPLKIVAELKDFEVDLGLNPYDYLVRRQAIDLIRKYPFKGNRQARQTKAVEKLLQGEEVCRKVNNRIEYILLKDSGVNPRVVHLLEKASRIAHVILGRVEMEKVFSFCKFGPGTNVGLRDSRKTGAEVKFGEKITITSNLVPIAGALLKEFGAWDRSSLRCWSDRRFSVVDGNKIAFAPKDAFTDRTIASEPMLNSFFQLGIGNLMKSKLLSVGVDLRLGAKEKNALMAKSASISGSHSTIDIANASGCVSHLLVKWLLPAQWFELLSTFRSEVGIMQHLGLEDVKYEQFSSMGNGYTFELESLIFYSLIRAVVPPEEDVAVYGDDLIVPTRWTPQVVKLLADVGFATNASKSFTDGPFRESCGTDWLSGVAVRPLYIHKEITNEPLKVDLANRIRQHAVNSILSPGYGEGAICWRDCWRHVVSYIPRDLRSKISTPPYYPGGLWKGGLHQEFDSSGTLTPYTGLQLKPVQEKVLADDALMAARLKGVIGGNTTTLRRTTTWALKPGLKYDNGGRTWGGWG